MVLTLSKHFSNLSADLNPRILSIVSSTISVTGSVTPDMATTLQLIMLALVGGTLGQANNTDYKIVLSSILGQLEGGLELHLGNSGKGANDLVHFIMVQGMNSLQISLNQEEEPQTAETGRHKFYMFENVKEMQGILTSLVNTDG